MPKNSLSDAHRKMLEVESGITRGIVEARGYFTATTKKELLELGFKPDQAIVPALVIPFHGVDGTVCQYQARPDEPRLNTKGKPVKYETPAGSQMRLDICPIESAREMLHGKGDLWITEGVKKGDSAAVRGLCCVALAGVWNWRGTNDLGGVTELPDWDKINLKGRKVYIAFDSDVMVKNEVLKALRRLSAMLKRRGAKAVIPIVPHIKGHDGKLGLDDFFAKGGTLFELQQCADHELLSETSIVINNRSLADVTADAIDALLESNIPPTLFVRGGELVRVITDERGITKIQGVNLAAMKGMLARTSKWIRKHKEGETEVSPPGEVAEDLMALGTWPAVPPIVAVTKAPVLARSGHLSMAPGYCPESHFLVACTETWPDFEGTVQDAVGYIFNEVFTDFMFAGPADKAHTLALTLLPIVRPAIDGPTPLHLIDAPVQGSGKSLLAKVCISITAGAEVSSTTGTKDEEEWRKKIASSLLEGRSYVLFDNLSRKIDSDSLAGVLTSTEWNDRALQQMRNINVPVRCVWLATANNAELSRDILRRTVWIRIDTGFERPEDREGFKHPHIEAFVQKNRRKIVAAICCIIRGWLDAGQPAYTGRVLGSFEEWSNVIGGILQHAGVNGFLGNIEDLRGKANSEHTSWVAFIARWWDRFGNDPVRAADIKELFDEDEDLAGGLGRGDQTQRLGYLIRKRIGVVFGPYRIERCEVAKTSSARYRLEPVEASKIGVSAQTPTTPTKPLLLNLDAFEPDEEDENRGSRGSRGISNLISRADARARTCEESPEDPKTPKSPTEPIVGPDGRYGEVEL